MLSGELELEQTMAIASVTWRLNDSVQFMGGALYNDIFTDIALTGPQTTRLASIGEDWVDPIIGVLFETLDCISTTTADLRLTAILLGAADHCRGCAISAGWRV